MQEIAVSNNLVGFVEQITVLNSVMLFWQIFTIPSSDMHNHIGVCVMYIQIINRLSCFDRTHQFLWTFGVFCMIVNIGLILKTSDQNGSLMKMASLLKMNGWFHLVLEDECVLEKFWQETCCFLFFRVSCRSSHLELQKKIRIPQLILFQGSQQHLHLSGFKWQNASCTLAIMNAMHVLQKCQDSCKWEGCGRKWSWDSLKLFWYFLEQMPQQKG